MKKKATKVKRLISRVVWTDEMADLHREHQLMCAWVDAECASALADQRLAEYDEGLHDRGLASDYDKYRDRVDETRADADKAKRRVYRAMGWNSLFRRGR